MKGITDKLIINLFDRGVIRVNLPEHKPGLTPTFFDVQIGEMAHTNNLVRWRLANLFREALLEHFRDGNRQRAFGLIGVSPTMPPIVCRISDRVGNEKVRCPIISIATRSDVNGHAYTNMYGKPSPGYHYAMVDDCLRTGRTILRAVKAWLREGYPIDIIVVFCDLQEGHGRQTLEQELIALSESIGMPPPTLVCLTTRDDILLVLKRAGRVSIADARLAANMP